MRKGYDHGVVDWYRALVGKKTEWLKTKTGWTVDAEAPRYAKYFGDMVRAVGQRYDGHPGFESLCIVGRHCSAH